MNKNVVQFARGTKSFYSSYSLELKLRKIYFTTDTNEIIVNDVVYGVNLNDTNLSLISEVTQISPDKFLFTATNGLVTTLTIPLAQATYDSDGNVVTKTAGLLSADDKVLIDSISKTYATKEELNNSVSKVYKYKGTKMYFDDLPQVSTEATPLVIGDTYNILQPFTIDGEYYAAGTNVAWDGSKWDPLGGVTNAYSKEEADNKFVPWTSSGDSQLIVLPKGSKLIGTQIDNSGANLIQLGIYDNGYSLVDVGTIKEHLCLNSKDRPHLDLPEGKKEGIAYLSDLGVIDMSGYDSTAQMIYIPELTQDFITENSVPANIDGEVYNAASNFYVIGKDYIAIIYKNLLNDTVYDLITVDSNLPNAVVAMIRGLREEYMLSLTWEIN